MMVSDRFFTGCHQGGQHHEKDETDTCKIHHPARRQPEPGSRGFLRADVPHPPRPLECGGTGFLRAAHGVAIDEIAERIRAVGAYAIGGLGTLAAAAQMKEFDSPRPQEAYVSALLAANEKLVKDAIKARDLAGEVNDPETQDLMTERITLHQKTIWMLKSFLK